MSAKTLVFLCMQGLMAHAIFAQCYNNAYNPAYGIPGNGYNMAASGYNNMAATGYNNMAATGYNNIPGSGIGCNNNNGLASNNIVGISALNSATINGGGFTVTSSSPIAPSGVSVVSEYVIEGPLTVGGQLPVLSTVAVDAQLPSNGAAGTSYACGNGNVGIINEQVYSTNAAANNIAASAAAGAAVAGANSALAAEVALNRPSGCGAY